ncbi:MAG: hypothetical protein ACC657_10500 [Thiohalomonadales bacterium]
MYSSKNIYITLNLLVVLVMLNACSSLTEESNASWEDTNGEIKNNNYTSPYHYFSVDIPSIFKAENISFNEFDLLKKRLIVNFGPELPDTTIFTVQVANIEKYDDTTVMGSINIFDSGGDNIIRDDFASSFFDSLFKSIKFYQYKSLVQNHFKHHGDDVTYAVFKVTALDKNKPFKLNDQSSVRYYVFYLTKMNERGVLVWLQIPVNGSSTDGRSEKSLINRTWKVQNDFFDSLVVTGL